MMTCLRIVSLVQRAHGTRNMNANVEHERQINNFGNKN